MVDAPLVLGDLLPDPREEWRRLLRFAGWSERDRLAAARSVDALFAHGRELVVALYDHLGQVPETAALLGWKDGPDPGHLAERRQFLTVWLARTLGLDTSDELALSLFRTGLVHAGLGPRRIHVPPGYVMGSIGLVLASFARYMDTENVPASAIAEAMAAWSRYLTTQLAILQLGYQAAMDLRDGALDVRCAAYGRLRPLLGGSQVEIGVRPGGRVADALRKLFNAYPEVRVEALDRVWDDRSPHGDLQTEVVPMYVPRPGWRVLLNGRDVRYGGGFQVPIVQGDELALFPPGR